MGLTDLVYDNIFSCPRPNSPNFLKLRLQFLLIYRHGFRLFFPNRYSFQLLCSDIRKRNFNKILEKNFIVIPHTLVYFRLSFLSSILINNHNIKLHARHFQYFKPQKNFKDIAHLPNDQMGNCIPFA
jgi:hypothetical protein